MAKSISTQADLDNFCSNVTKMMDNLKLSVHKNAEAITVIQNSNILSAERHEHLMYKMSVMNDRLVDNGNRIDKLNSQLMKYFAYGKPPENVKMSRQQLDIQSEREKVKELPPFYGTVPVQGGEINPKPQVFNFNRLL